MICQEITKSVATNWLISTPSHLNYSPQISPFSISLRNFSTLSPQKFSHSLHLPAQNLSIKKIIPTQFICKSYSLFDICSHIDSKSLKHRSSLIYLWILPFFLFLFSIILIPFISIMWSCLLFHSFLSSFKATQLPPSVHTQPTKFYIKFILGKLLLVLIRYLFMKHQK